MNPDLQRSGHPVAQAVLGWMQANGMALRALLDEEGREAEDTGPSSDAAIRAHVRFVARALAATAAPARAGVLAAFERDLPRLIDEREGDLRREIAALGEASAHEAALQFGREAAEDPVHHGVVDRRVRLQAWSRLFLTLLEECLAPGGDGLGDRARVWMAGRQDELANTIFSMDRRAKEAEIARHGPQSIDDADVVNRIGQAVVVQAHVRFLVEAVAASL